MAGSAGTELSRGGMVTKIEAGQHRARLRHQHGDHLGQGACIPCARCRQGAPCTWFLAPSDPVTARKRWIAGQLEPKGIVEIDAGAEKALLSGKSLLPAGVQRVEGAFERGDAVIIRAADGRELGRGLVAYARADAARIIGKQEQRDRRHPRPRRPHRAGASRRHGAEQGLTRSTSTRRESPRRWRTWPTPCARSARQAREAARALALAPTQAKNAALRRRGARAARPDRSHPRRQRSATSPPPTEAGRPAVVPRPPDARSQAHRGHGQGPGGDRGAARSGRQRARRSGRGRTA